MKLFKISPVYAHCDLPCGVYDPAQARVEAESVLAIQEKMEGLDPDNRIRAIIIKEQRAELVKHHLWVLWTDYFKPPHLEKYPSLHEKFWNATKQASECKQHSEPEEGKKLVAMIDEIAEIFWETKRPPNMFRRVVGTSMTPTLSPGQIIYVRRWHYKPLINDIIVIKHDGLEKVKRISQINANGLFVTGDNPRASTDSRQLGLIPFQSVLGKAIRIF